MPIFNVSDNSNTILRNIPIITANKNPAMASENVTKKWGIINQILLTNKINTCDGRGIRYSGILNINIIASQRANNITKDIRG